MARLIAGNQETGAAPNKARGPAESKLTKFLKIFGFIFGALAVIGGLAGGGYFFLKKRRAAKSAAASTAEPEADQSAKATAPAKAPPK